MGTPQDPPYPMPPRPFPLPDPDAPPDPDEDEPPPVPLPSAEYHIKFTPSPSLPAYMEWLLSIDQNDSRLCEIRPSKVNAKAKTVKT
jgi:hypothetical protein